MQEPIEPIDGGLFLWSRFLEWAEENGVGLEHVDDWGIWWECWKAAIVAQENRP